MTLPDVGSVWTGGTKRQFRWWIDYSPHRMVYEFFVTRTDFEMIPMDSPRFTKLTEDEAHPGYSTAWSESKMWYLQDDGRWVEIPKRAEFRESPTPAHSMTAELVHVLAGAGVPIDPAAIADDMAKFLKRMLDGIGHVLDPNPTGGDDIAADTNPT